MARRKNEAHKPTAPNPTPITDPRLNPAPTPAPTPTPATSPPASSPPHVFDAIEARSITIRDASGAPRITLGLTDKNEASIEVKTPAGDSRVKLQVDERSAASVWVNNGQAESIVLFGDDDMLQITITGKHGFPRFEVSSDDDNGVTLGLCPIAEAATRVHGPKIWIGLDSRDQPSMSILPDDE